MLLSKERKPNLLHCLVRCILMLKKAEKKDLNNSFEDSLKVSIINYISQRSSDFSGQQIQ